MEANDLSCEAVVAKLRELAPDKTARLNVSTVWRHMTGHTSPPESMKALYLQLTGAAVTPTDWFALSQDPTLGKRPTKVAGMDA